MAKSLPYLIFLVFLNTFSFSQEKLRVTKKPTIKTQKKFPKKTNLALGLGATRSVVYLARNVKPNNDATGMNFSLIYGGAKLLRMSLEYTHYFKKDMAPTWYGVTANTIEFNVHALARLRNKNSYFYPLMGLSYNTFSGVYTGINDYLNLNDTYEENEKVVTNWVGLNLGTGYEFYFKPGSFFIDYKMRIGVTEGYNEINIQDVCISAGLRFNIKAPSVYSLFIYRGTRSRYLLDTND